MPIPDCPYHFPEQCSEQYQEREVAMSALAVALIFAFAWLLTLATGDSSSVASMRGTARFVTWSGHLRASAWRCVLTLANLLLTPILDAAHLRHCRARSCSWCGDGEAAAGDHVWGSQRIEVHASSRHSLPEVKPRSYSLAPRRSRAFFQYFRACRPRSFASLQRGHPMKGWRMR